MPLTNYCKKCSQDVPMGETCPRCGARLTRAGERLTWTVVRVPVKDFFSWNAMLRVVVPVMALVLGGTALMEALARGSQGVQNVFVQGFFWIMLFMLGIFLALTWLILWLQGQETVRYILDAKGVHTRVTLQKPTPIRLYARFTTPLALEALAAQGSESMTDGMPCIRKTDTAWAQIRRFAQWPETRTVILFSPAYWSVAHLLCPSQEAYEQALAYVQKKAPKSRHKTAARKRKP